ncbi:tetratricopeptide repeat protein [Herpetosiphon llansteffanensis]|uniref:tetratricopeptide repeat protein n=1 Tax=Herpetosiphon llansteffanensis TaxID=2094568 RepID=UPI000D7CE7A4|nr:tetratricopeptide repeat protein [Herpetosiphon llansteffanensis]
MELPKLIGLLVDAVLAVRPEADRQGLAVAFAALLAGTPAHIEGHSLALLIEQTDAQQQATIAYAGQTITIDLPQAIDPLAAALAAVASIPLETVPRVDQALTAWLPFAVNPTFVGREDELRALAAAIGNAQPTVVLPAVAIGLGGFGKTSLVTEFAYRYGRYFHGGVFWINCAEPEQIVSQIVACGEALALDLTGLVLDAQVQQVFAAWQSPMPRLLVFDNCEDPALLEHWLPKIGGCRVVVTARSDQWPKLTTLRLGVLAPAESRSLLQQLCPRLTSAEAESLAVELGHLPLALHLAGSYLATKQQLSVKQYRQDFAVTHRSLKSHAGLPSPTRHEQDVEATFMLSLNQFDPANPLEILALDMLDGAAWCAPGVPIPRALVLDFVPNEIDDELASAALNVLEQRGLIDGGDMLVVHRLLAQVVQLHRGLEHTRDLVEARINEHAVRISATRVPNYMLPLEPHLRHVTLRALERDTERTARLCNSLGYWEHMRGRYGEAELWYERGLAMMQAVLGPEHVNTTRMMNNLAGIRLEQMRYAEAQSLYEQVLAIWKVALGPDHPDTARCMNNLASALGKQGQNAEALAMYEQALAVWEAALGPAHPDTAISVNNLAVALEREGRYAEAQALHERALSVYKRAFGLDHPDTATSINGLARVLERQGRYSQAQQLYQQALTIRETALGPEHPDTATNLNALADLLLEQKHYPEAQALYERALAIRELVFGPEHPETITIMANIGVVLDRRGQYSEALALHEQAFVISEKILGADDETTQRIRTNHARTLQAQQAAADQIAAKQLGKRADAAQSKPWK